MKKNPTIKMIDTYIEMKICLKKEIRKRPRNKKEKKRKKVKKIKMKIFPKMKKIII